MQKNIIWKGLDADTEENCAVTYMHEGIVVRSEIAGWVDKQPVTVEYVVKLNKEWQVLEFKVTAQTGSEATQCYAMQRDDTGNWKGMSGLDYPEYDGCDYIDITLTPLTNTLLINGLRLKEGESREIDVVYIDIMEKEVRKDKQRYTKLKTGKYRFENGFSTEPFIADIDVDENGFVTNYPQLFETI